MQTYYFKLFYCHLYSLLDVVEYSLSEYCKINKIKKLGMRPFVRLFSLRKYFELDPIECYAELLKGSHSYDCQRRQLCAKSYFHANLSIVSNNEFY